VLSDAVLSDVVLADEVSELVVVLVLLPHAIRDIAIAAQRHTDKSFFFIKNPPYDN
jgi:hypothetical protein